MPTARVNGINIFYEEVGEGTPLIFVHEFAGRRRAGISRCASSPAAIAASPSTRAAIPLRRAQRSQGVLAGPGRRGHLWASSTPSASPRRTSAGSAWAATPSLHFGLRWPERALSLVIAGAGYGSVPGRRRVPPRRGGDGRSLRARRDEGGGRVLHQGPHPRAVHGQGPRGLAGVLRHVLRAVGPGPRPHHAGCR